MRLSDRKSGPGDPVIIKKYANRRLYNTKASSYVTLDHLCEMVKEGVDFEVRDARTGEDITRQVLTQIIVEEEGKGHNLLPIKFLRQLIGLYGDNLQAFVPRYLEMSMESFARNQEQLREKFADAFGGLGYKNFETIARQNMAIFEQAMKMFAPVARQMRENGPDAKSTRGNGGEAKDHERDDEIRELKDQIETMRRQLAELAGRK
ncbi:MAG: polyhydroxyalkanoate synthesis repressor PhaR [Alphaproteobacteria bacterium]